MAYVLWLMIGLLVGSEMNRAPEEKDSFLTKEIDFTKNDIWVDLLPIYGLGLLLFSLPMMFKLFRKLLEN